MGIYDNPTWTNLDPRMKAAYLQLAAGAQQAGHQVGLGSGWRSHDDQKRLYAEKPNLAAPPGRSNHEYGLASDLTYSSATARQWVHQNAHKYGLWFPMDYEPWHAQLIGIDRHNLEGGAQIGGGRDAFSALPDGRFVNPYDRLSDAVAQEDPYDPLEQFGRLVQMFAAGGADMSMVESPDSGGLLEAPQMAGPSTEPEELLGAVSGTADPTGAVAKEGDQDGR